VFFFFLSKTDLTDIVYWNKRAMLLGA